MGSLKQAAVNPRGAPLQLGCVVGGSAGTHLAYSQAQLFLTWRTFEMKKSLIALAALAATGAFAQSSVTLYGRAEAGMDLGFRTKVDSTNTTVIVGPGASTTNTNLGSSVSKPGFRISDGDNQGQASSRFGMRGSEDLGGGLRANFVLEAGVTLDDGAAGTGGGNFFSQSAWVGLSGGFGEVRLGRQVLGSFDVYASGLSAAWGSGLYEVGATFVQGGDVRASNAIQYRSPDFGGISGTVSLLAPETNRSTSTPVVGGNSTTSSSNKTGVDLSVAYAAGPVYVGFGYNKQNTTASTNNGLAGAANATTSSSGPRTDYTISASYDFGVAQPFFNYTNRKDRSNSVETAGGVVTGIGSTTLNGSGENTKSRQYALGVKVPLGNATLLTSFGTHKTTGSATQFGGGVGDSVERKVRAFQIGAQYPLSKRTMLQANYGINNQKDRVTSTALLGANSGSFTSDFTTTKVRGLNFGVAHTF
jgi:predicted porin